MPLLRADEPRLLRHDPAAVARGLRGGPHRRPEGPQPRSPWWAFVMLLVMFSLAGMPPTIGFYGKLLVLQAAVKAGFVWLAVVGVLAALIGAFYYLRIVKLMYFDEPRRPLADRGARRHARAAVGQRPGAAAVRHPAAAADGPVRRGAGAVAVLSDVQALRRRMQDARSRLNRHARRILRHLPGRPDAAVDRLRRARSCSKRAAPRSSCPPRRPAAASRRTTPATAPTPSRSRARSSPNSRAATTSSRRRVRAAA